MRERDYKSALAPLEAALRLATDDETRLKVYNNLMPCYRLLPENDKMIEACEFTILKTKDGNERSNISGSLTSFLYQRGKLDEIQKKYEGILAKDAEDLISLTMLLAIHKIDFKAKDKQELYRTRLDKVEQKLAKNLAEEEEKLAATDAPQTTWHWKQAAVYWIKATDSAKALQAAKQAEATGPEKRGDLLLHFWHAQLGDVYLAANAPQDAIRHFEKAIATTTIDGYKKTCTEKLATAKAKLAEQPKKP